MYTRQELDAFKDNNMQDGHMYIVIESGNNSEHFFIIPRDKIIKHSGLIKSMVDDDDTPFLDVPIPYPEVNDKALTYVSYYITHDNKSTVEQPLITAWVDCVNKWEIEYMNALTNNKQDNTFMYDVLNHAHYMDSRELILLCCSYIADIIKDHTPEEIRDILALESAHPPPTEHTNIIFEDV